MREFLKLIFIAVHGINLLMLSIIKIECAIALVICLQQMKRPNSQDAQHYEGTNMRVSGGIYIDIEMFLNMNIEGL